MNQNQNQTHPLIILVGGVFLTLLCIGLAGGAYLFGTGGSLLPRSGVDSGGYAEVPTAIPNETVVQNLETLSEEVEVPGAESAGVVATAIPWQNVQNLGNAEQFRRALETFYSEQIFDYRINAVVSTATSSVYCDHYYRRKAGDNDALPLIDRIERGTAELVTWVGNTRYCVGVTAVGELWAGVPQADLQDFTINTNQYVLVDPEQKTQTTNETVDVELTVRFGMLTQSVQAGNVQKTTYDDPSLFATAMVGVIEGGDYLRLHTDRIDNLANSLAMHELIAPFYPRGDGRDMSNLEDLEALIRRAYTQPSSDPANPSPYDHLLALAEQAALQAGYQGVGEFTITLVWPYEQGEWYYLQGLDGPNPTRVVKPDDYVQFQDNLYELFRSEIPTQ